jgi:hypothetical protein
MGARLKYNNEHKEKVALPLKVLISVFAVPLSFIRVETGVDLALVKLAATSFNSNSDKFCGGNLNIVSGATVNGIVTSKNNGYTIKNVKFQKVVRTLFTRIAKKW